MTKLQYINHSKYRYIQVLQANFGYGEEATLENIIKALADCKAVLVSKIGDCPKEELHKAGIQTVEAYDLIDKVALEFYKEAISE